MYYDDTVLISFKKNDEGNWIPDCLEFLEMFKKYSNEQLENSFCIINGHHCLKCKVTCNPKGQITDILSIVPANKK